MKRIHRPIAVESNKSQNPRFHRKNAEKVQLVSCCPDLDSTMASANAEAIVIYEKVQLASCRPNIFQRRGIRRADQMAFLIRGRAFTSSGRQFK
jgi:hypothetical protein